MFLEQLKNHYEKLSLNEQEVIDYLMKQENLDTLTLKKMSADLYLSSSTIELLKMRLLFTMWTLTGFI